MQRTKAVSGVLLMNNARAHRSSSLCPVNALYTSRTKKHMLEIDDNSSHHSIISFCIL